jgi:hypothetical protein
LVKLVVSFIFFTCKQPKFKPAGNTALLDG